MADNTKIEWCTTTWSPVTGCTPISEGCAHCYAKRMANRLRGRYGYPADDPFKVTMHPDRLGQPSHWGKPRMVFVASMGDLFHKDVPYYFLLAVLDRIRDTPRHVFQVLTKRPGRARSATRWTSTLEYNAERQHIARMWPLPNLWLGVSAENQERWEERKREFFLTPAVVHFLSYEPALGPLVLSEDDLRQLDWVICGGESGPGARPMPPDWARALRDQCVNAGIPYFFKQHGAWTENREDAPETAPSESVYVGPERDSYRCRMMYRVGKKRAGRLLDGRVWDEMPEVKP